MDEHRLHAIEQNIRNGNRVSIADTRDLIADVRRLQRHLTTYENMDMATRAALGLPDGSGLGTVETINFLRFERDAARTSLQQEREALLMHAHSYPNDPIAKVLRTSAWCERNEA